MTTLRFLADMNLSPVTVRSLQERGLDVIRVSDLLSATTSDAEILEFARRVDRVIVTQDLDFSALLALAGYDRPSLITLRLSVTDPATVTNMLLKILSEIASLLRQGAAITVDDRKIRVRTLPIQRDR